MKIRSNLMPNFRNSIPKTPSKRREPVDRDTATKMRRWVDHIGVDFLNKSTQDLGISLQDVKGFNPKSASLEFLHSEK